MRVGVYVDGFNLYYGARKVCGRGTPGWRWLNIRGLAGALVAAQPGWAGSTIDRVVYCTATIDPASNKSGHDDQQTYLKALRASGSVDAIAYGQYVSRVKVAPLATPDAKGKPTLTHPDWPVMVQDAAGLALPNAVFMVAHARREEKGSDVNVASHLLFDIFNRRIEAAVVISNDSDLSFPVAEARELIPLGTVNPSAAHPARALQGSPTTGPGAHWWVRITDGDYRSHQLPDPVPGRKGAHPRPVGW